MSSDDENDIPTWKGVPATIVLINLLDPEKKNTAAIAHKATCAMLRQHLRSASSQQVGVSLYGVENSDSVFGIKSVIDIVPLSAPNLQNFKNLQNLDMSAYTTSQDLILSEVLRHCSKLFANCKKQLSTRTVILLTRLDSPPDRTDQKPTFKTLEDLVLSNIEIKLVNISKDEYTINPFYEDFLLEANKGMNYVIPKAIWDCKEIEHLLHQESHRHLAVAKLEFEIGAEMSIGVGIYSLIKSQTYLKQTDLDRDTNAIVSRSTKTMKVTVSDDNELSMDVDEPIEPKEVPVLKSELLHYQIYGGERIEFTDDEMKKIKNPFGPPMLKLLGFKPSKIMCKEKWFLKPGYFLFPSETKIQGSTMALKALHQACINMSVVAICVLCTRVNSKPHIVALSPTIKPLNLDVEFGFDVINIPFIENVRDVPYSSEDDRQSVSEANKSFLKDILKRTMFDYKPVMFENPKQQSEYRALEAIALDEKDLQPFVDTTIRDPSVFEHFDERLFEELFGPFGIAAPKRTGECSHAGPSSKKSKITDINESSLKEHIKNKTVQNYTVAQLKEILKTKPDIKMQGLNTMKKNQLVELVYEHFD